MSSLSSSLLQNLVADVREGNFSSSTVLYTVVLAAAVALSLLNRLLTPRIDPREPPVVKPRIPWIGHIIGVIRHQADYNRILQCVSPSRG
jgi:hypothetical protein